MDSPTSRLRLCIYCRDLEFVGQPCSRLLARSTAKLKDTIETRRPASGLSREDQHLIERLQQKSSIMCHRCSEYDVISAFRDARPLDQNQRVQLSEIEFQKYHELMDSYRLRLGRPSLLLLTPSCPLCRLFYCILPSTVEEDEAEVHIEPYRSYIRVSGWEIIPDQLRQQCAIFLGLAAVSSLLTPVGDPFKPGDEVIRSSNMTGPAIALQPYSAEKWLKLLNGLPLQSTLDLSLLRKPLDHCMRHHGDYCQVAKSPKLLITKMIDVEKRSVVACPEDCDYIALSYVWGGIQPTPGALESRCLPQTIEDAIDVTKALGRQYLWVDALCIDQSPNPTPMQMQAKQEQLKLMSTIYGCATVTIIALTGENSNAGLAGISNTRPKQLTEVINGQTLFTVPHHLSHTIANSEWSRRAWTLQEIVLSRRSLYFSPSQVEFSCMLSQVAEGTDSTSVSEKLQNLPQMHSVQSMQHRLLRPQINPQSSDSTTSTPVRDTEGRMRFFDAMLSTYTSRRLSYEGDSLNAFLGMVAALEQNFFEDDEFLYGLPLKAYPASLGWVHDRNILPKRREGFPSWSWAGWEGSASLMTMLVDSFDDHSSATTAVDLEPSFVALNGATLTMECFTVMLDIRTEPFSEVFIPEHSESVGTIMEGRSLHNNTLKTGKYSCLVLQRASDRDTAQTPPRQKICMIVLDWKDDVAQRRTLVTMTLFHGCEFMQTKPEWGKVRLR